MTVNINQEIERRFLVTGIDPDIRRFPSRRIQQGYFETPPDFSLRVRTTDGERAELTRKDGIGISRREETVPLALDAAKFLLASCVDQLQKVRFLRDGWEVDFYEGPLAGLVVAEFESPDAAAVALPPWIHAAQEVTDTVNNRVLARLASDLAVHGDNDRPVRDRLVRRLPRLVVTGGPCSGKTTLMAEIAARFGDTVKIVPETATVVMSQVGVRPPSGKDRVALQRFQRILFRVQRGFEEIAETEAIADGKSALILDRGTMDGAAYLDGVVGEFEGVCRTSAAYEFAQYDRVICLAPPPPDVYAEKSGNNAVRSESHEQAVELGERLKAVWSRHPRFMLVDGRDWTEKSVLARGQIADFLART